MKPRSILMSLVFVSVVFIIMPYLAILSNSHLNLPVVRFGVQTAVGIILMAAGIILDMTCILMFVRIGKGSQVPLDPPKRFVAAGPYRYVRNPMYLGLFSVLLGEFLFFGQASLLIYLLLIGAIINVSLRKEERTLAKRFGNEYKAYMKKVPAWIPKFN